MVCNFQHVCLCLSTICSPSSSAQGGKEEESDHLRRRFQRYQTAAEAEATQSRGGLYYLLTFGILFFYRAFSEGYIVFLKLVLSLSNYYFLSHSVCTT